MWHNTVNRMLLALSPLFLLSSALPFFPLPKLAEPLLQLRASYSVVPVDGGASTAGAGEQITTATVTETIISTVTPAPALPLTVTSTVTPELPTVTVTQSYSIAHGTETIIIASTVAGQNVVQTSIVTIMPDPITVTLTATPSPTTSTKTYDDGMWHTTYPPWSNSSSVATATPLPKARLV